MADVNVGDDLRLQDDNEGHVVLNAAPPVARNLPFNLATGEGALYALATVIEQFEARLSVVEGTITQGVESLSVAHDAARAQQADGARAVASALQRVETTLRSLQDQQVEATEAVSDAVVLFDDRLDENFRALATYMGDANEQLAAAINDVNLNMAADAESGYFIADRMEIGFAAVRDALVFVIAGLAFACSLMYRQDNLLLSSAFVAVTLIGIHFKLIYPVFLLVMFVLWLFKR